VAKDVTVAAEGQGIDALGQFKLHTVGSVVGESLNFTQANLMMLVAAGLTLAMLYFGARKQALVPGRLQALAELSYDFIHSMCIDQIGEEGKKFFPLVFTLFFFILLGNLLGIWAYAFTFTSHIATTLTLTLLVWGLTTAVGLYLHGWKFFTYFVPPGVPKFLLPLLVPIEILSYLSRLISLSVRLFANMVAGHIMLEVFAGFVVMLAGAGVLFWVPAGLSFTMDVVLIGFEFLVAVLQAYVFALLTCIYLHDAVHLH
jgi:F-type H+-transporting ATPase subunit a